jgi:hypothetical protein
MAQVAETTGFITLLIFGSGVRLLPGFARRDPRSPALSWLTLALGNSAALLRTGPLLLLPAGPAADALLALAGVASLLAVALFGINLTGAARRRTT